MSIKMQRRIIEQCAPTLAGLKCAGLFHYKYSSAAAAKTEIEEISAMLNDKGVYIEALSWKDKSALIYVYRPAMLEGDLKEHGVQELLKNYGYEKGNDYRHFLNHLKTRIASSTCFPHEIGVFLGYPLEDVCGFIEHKGRNCESCGMWKVYCNKEEKDRLFRKYRKCKDVYIQVFRKGRELSRMTVCAAR